jgi:hypothetical protein
MIISHCNKILKPLGPRKYEGNMKCYLLMSVSEVQCFKISDFLQIFPHFKSLKLIFLNTLYVILCCLVWRSDSLSRFLQYLSAVFDCVARFSQHLMAMFDSTPEWDRDSSYIPSELNIYYECRARRTLHQVAASNTLGEVLARER